MHTPLRTRTPAIEHDEVEDILNDLTKLNLDGRQILGDKTNVESKTSGGAKKGKKLQTEIIEINSDSDGNSSVETAYLMPKAARLSKLASRASHATNNLALANLIEDFVEVLRSNSSRTLTKEGSHFLDVLHKQLADPSVFVTPIRYVECILAIKDRLKMVA